MKFLRSLVSKKLMVTGAAAAFITTLPMSADAKGIAVAALALVYVLAQAYVDSFKEVADDAAPVDKPPVPVEEEK